MDCLGEDITLPLNTQDEDDYWDTDCEDDDVVSTVFDPVQEIRNVYLAACRECGVRPVSFFTRNLHNVRINLAHHGIGDLGMKAIAISLMSDTHLTGLNVCDNGLHDAGLKYLCELLWENYYITDINVSENELSNDGVLHLCGALAQTDTIKRLAVQGNRLDDKSAMLIAEVMKTNVSLKYVDLSNNCFAEEGGLHFGPALARNEHIVDLNLSWNNLRRKGAYAIAKSLVDNITLKKLNLSMNGFADDGVLVLSESLKHNGSLEHLDISDNRITAIGAAHLQKALKENEGLVVLKAGRNPLQHGTAFIIQGIKENSNSTIQELDLSFVQVNKSFVDLLNDIHKKRPTFQSYHAGFSGADVKPAERPKPMKVLRDYVKGNCVRILDVFNSLDKDKNMSISVSEFVQGLQQCGVPLRQDELYELVRSLDTNGDGEVDYKELVSGDKEMKLADRMELKKARAKQEKDKQQLAKDLRPSTPSKGLPLIDRSPQKSPRNPAKSSVEPLPPIRNPSPSARPESGRPNSSRLSSNSRGGTRSVTFFEENGERPMSRASTNSRLQVDRPASHEGARLLSPSPNAPDFESGENNRPHSGNSNGKVGNRSNRSTPLIEIRDAGTSILSTS